MQPSVHDAAYLWDILDAARTALELVSDLSFEAYVADRRTRLAVERLVEIVGEAANKVSAEFQRAHPEIPWRRMIAQRNVLAHEYGEIKQERMWVVITERLPALISLLEPLVPTPPQASE